MMLLKLLAGPLVFVVISLVRLEGLSLEGQLALATFGWTMAWWMLQPVPWTVTAVLPVVILPLLGVMTARAVASLYGQSIIFWLMGTSMLGWALEKHGLARRFAFTLLSIPGVCATTNRIAFTFMLAIGAISMVVSDLAVIAMAIPIAMSIASSIDGLGAPRADAPGRVERSNFSAMLVLGAFYAAVAGGTATIAGTPPNAISVSLLQTLMGQTVGWFEWMARGVPIFLILLVVFYFVLKWLFPPEMSVVPGGEAFIRAEMSRLGPLRRAEWNVLLCFSAMVVLFLVGPIASLILGPDHRVAHWLTSRLDIWVVPPIILVALFVLPVDLRTNEFTLTWRDAVEHTPWNVIFLSIAASAMLDVLSTFGFMKLLGNALNGVTVNVMTLPLIGLILAVYTNIDGSAIAFTAGFGGILIPAAVRMGLHPTTVTMMIPQVAIGMLWPGSGPAAATAFASQKIALRDMVKAGLVVTPLFGLIVGLVHMVFELAK